MKQEYIYNALVIRVIDGDTIECEIDLGFHISRVEKLRIMNYDAPEKTLRDGTTEEEKALGIEATEYAENLFHSYPEIVVRTYYNKQGKYGRFLADVTVLGDDEDFDYADHMKAKGYIKKGTD